MPITLPDTSFSQVLNPEDTNPTPAHFFPATWSRLRCPDF